MHRFKIISLEQALIFGRMKGYIIVDLRSQKEYLEGHLDNAINMPNATIDIINQYERKNYTWILYCKRGSMSFKLAKVMADYGYDVMTVVGGYR